MLHCDSQSAIMLAKNPMFHEKTKHIAVKYHFIQDVLQNKQIELVKVHTIENLANLLRPKDFQERALCIVVSYWALDSWYIFVH